MDDLTTRAERWRRDLAAWAIPEEILAAARESPWTCSPRLFARRADESTAAPGGPSYARAREALPADGSVLDVGAGAGAAALPLAGRAGRLVAVDTSAEMLRLFAERARRLGVPAQTIPGRWPDVAGQVPPADVVVCHNVVYNAPDLPDFLSALTAHARRRVVVELTERHPRTPLAPLWRLFHGLALPEGPTADDAIAIARALGYEVGMTRWVRAAHRYDDFAELVAQTCRMLCLPPDRAGEVAAALRQSGVDPADPRFPPTGERAVVTLWWPGAAPR